MAGSGLIAIEKVVERLGKSHRQRYWVKPSELRALVKQGKVSEAVTKLGGDSEAVQKLVKQWRASPGSVGTATMRAACARAVHGAKPAMIQRELDRSTRTASNAHGVGEAGVGKSESRHVQDVTQAFNKGLEDDGVRKNVAALATVAQSMYEQPTVELWRGIRGNSSNAYLYDEAYEAIQKDPDAEITISTGVLSSFSDDPDQAKAFATMSSGAGETSEGFYFKLKVPRDSIVMSHRVKGMDPGKTTEKEVTVLTSGSIRIRARDIVQARDKPGSGLELLVGKKSSEKAKPAASSVFVSQSLEEYSKQFAAFKKPMKSRRG